MNNLYWKHESLFSCSYRLLENYTQVGYIKRARWQRTFTSELNGQKFIFKPKGFFKRETIIINSENNTVGLITKDKLNSNAVITLEGKTYPFTYSNMWQTKWRIKSSLDNSIDYKSNGYNYDGNLSNNENNNLLILAGLYTNFWKIENSKIIIAICLTPIYVNIIQMVVKYFFNS